LIRAVDFALYNAGMSANARTTPQGMMPPFTGGAPQPHGQTTHLNAKGMQQVGTQPVNLAGNTSVPNVPGKSVAASTDSTNPQEYWSQHAALKAKYHNDVIKVHNAFKKYVDHMKEQSETDQKKKLRYLLSYVNLCATVLSEDPSQNQPRKLDELDKVYKYIVKIVNPYLKKLHTETNKRSSTHNASGSTAPASALTTPQQQQRQQQFQQFQRQQLLQKQQNPQTAQTQAQPQAPTQIQALPQSQTPNAEANSTDAQMKQDESSTEQQCKQTDGVQSNTNHPKSSASKEVGISQSTADSTNMPTLGSTQDQQPQGNETASQSEQSNNQAQQTASHSSRDRSPTGLSLNLDDAGFGFSGGGLINYSMGFGNELSPTGFSSSMDLAILDIDSSGQNGMSLDAAQDSSSSSQNQSQSQAPQPQGNTGTSTNHGASSSNGDVGDSSDLMGLVESL
jgi:hypothetical protein